MPAFSFARRSIYRNNSHGFPSRRRTVNCKDDLQRRGILGCREPVVSGPREEIYDVAVGHLEVDPELGVGPVLTDGSAA